MAPMAQVRSTRRCRPNTKGTSRSWPSMGPGLNRRRRARLPPPRRTRAQPQLWQAQQTLIVRHPLLTITPLSTPVPQPHQQVTVLPLPGPPHRACLCLGLLEELCPRPTLAPTPTARLQASPCLEMPLTPTPERTLTPPQPAWTPLPSDPRRMAGSCPKKTMAWGISRTRAVFLGASSGEPRRRNCRLGRAGRRRQLLVHLRRQLRRATRSRRRSRPL